MSPETEAPLVAAAISCGLAGAACICGLALIERAARDAARGAQLAAARLGAVLDLLEAERARPDAPEPWCIVFDPDNGGPARMASSGRLLRPFVAAQEAARLTAAQRARGNSAGTFRAMPLSQGQALAARAAPPTDAEPPAQDAAEGGYAVFWRAPEGCEHRISASPLTHDQAHAARDRAEAMRVAGGGYFVAPFDPPGAHKSAAA